MATIPMSILKVDGQEYEVVDAELREGVDPTFDLSKYATSGSDDKAIYDALVSLGWTDCIEGYSA